MRLQADSIRSRMAGTLPPGSPATMIFSTGEFGQVDLMLGRHFGQPQRVGRRAEQRRDFGAADQLQAGQAAHPAAGNDQRSAGGSASNALQKPNERPERKRHQRAILRRDLGRVEHVLPTSIHHCQSSAVSSTTSGRPRVPEV